MIDIWHYPLLGDAKMRKEILSQYFDGDFELVKSKRGQPLAIGLINGKIDVVYFSISHTDKKCFLAVSTNRSVGVDVEKKSRKLKHADVIKRYGSRDELAYYAKIKSVSKRREFVLKSWVLKEAVGKALGVGIQQGLFKKVNVLSAKKNKGDFRISSKAFHYQWVKSSRYWVVVVKLGFI